MRGFIIASFVLLTFSLEWFEEGNPHFLTGSDWNETIKDYSHCKFVKFFTPWCRYCRVLKDIIDNHKQTTYANSTDVRFYEINCHVSPDICMPFKIYTVPMIMIVNRNGEIKQTGTGVYPKEWYVEVINNNCEIPKADTQPETTTKQNDNSDKESKSQTKKGLTRHTQEHQNNNKTNENNQNSPKHEQNTVAKAEKHQTIEKATDPNKQDTNAKEIIIPTDSLQHFEAEEDENDLVVEQPIKEYVTLKTNNLIHKNDQPIEAPSTKSPKGRSWQTFLLLAFAFIVCFFLHNKFCTQNRNHQSI